MSHSESSDRFTQPTAALRCGKSIGDQIAVVSLRTTRAVAGQVIVECISRGDLMTKSTASKSTAKSRLAHELKSYAFVSAYLFVCFGVILFYDASTSNGQTADPISIGAALVKALVIGKFILIGELLKPGSRLSAPTLLHRIAWRTLGMLVVLIIMKLIEEVVIATVHGHGIAETMGELMRQPWRHLVAPTLMMLLILIPLMTAIELDRTLGEGGLRDLLLKRKP